MSPIRPRSWPNGGASAMRSSSGSSSATRAGCSGGDRAGEPAHRRSVRRAADAADAAPAAPLRRSPEARPRPELPDRLEHPRRDRARGGPRRGRRRARDRRWARRAERAPRAAVRARARGGGRPGARPPARGRACAAPEHHAARRRRDGARPARAAVGADEGRGQPAVRDRGGGDPADDRAARRRHALGGDGPARGRRALRRRAGIGRLRRPLRPRAALVRRARPPRDRAVGLPSGSERRLGARGPRAPRAGAAGRAACARPGGVRAPAQGARPPAVADPRIRGRRRARPRPRGAGGPRPSRRRARRAALAGRLPRALGGVAMTGALHEDAPAKLNLCLFLGPRRERDGRHELVTVFQPLTLADRVSLEPAPLGARGDDVSCPGVPGPPEENLAARALKMFRARTNWAGPPVRLYIDKRIPVAAGMAGGSADAGAALRLAARTAGSGDDALLRAIAAELGADVPAQVRPARYLATGAGEELRALG